MLVQGQQQTHLAGVRYRVAGILAWLLHWRSREAVKYNFEVRVVNSIQCCCAERRWQQRGVQVDVVGGEQGWFATSALWLCSQLSQTDIETDKKGIAASTNYKYNGITIAKTMGSNTVRSSRAFWFRQRPTPPSHRHCLSPLRYRCPRPQQPQWDPYQYHDQPRHTSRR